MQDIPTDADADADFGQNPWTDVDAIFQFPQPRTFPLYCVNVHNLCFDANR